MKEKYEKWVVWPLFYIQLRKLPKELAKEPTNNGGKVEARW